MTLNAKAGAAIKTCYTVMRQRLGTREQATEPQCLLAYSLAFGLRINALTGDESANPTGADGLLLSALGLRISRVLRFWALAMSVVSLIAARCGPLRRNGCGA